MYPLFFYKFIPDPLFSWAAILKNTFLKKSKKSFDPSVAIWKIKFMGGIVEKMLNPQRSF
jgi:hypothetical protein